MWIASGSHHHTQFFPLATYNDKDLPSQHRQASETNRFLLLPSPLNEVLINYIYDGFYFGYDLTQQIFALHDFGVIHAMVSWLVTSISII